MQNIFKTAIFATLLVLSGGHGSSAAESPSKEQRDEQVRKEILDQAAKMRQEYRNGDTAKFDEMTTPDYAEFDPYFPFLLDPPKSISVEIEKWWDLYDKLPRIDRPHKLEKIQVYDDVALLTFTSIAKGAEVTGGFMAQAKFLTVYVKKNGIWTLAFTHDGRRVGPEGLPID